MCVTVGHCSKCGQLYWSKPKFLNLLGTAAFHDAQYRPHSPEYMTCCSKPRWEDGCPVHETTSLLDVFGMAKEAHGP